jgi:hypothetical protein
MTHSRGSKVIFIGCLNGKSLGKYALLHCEFLRDYHPTFYKKLWATNKLHSWLCEIDEIAKRRFEFAEKFGCSFDETENSLFTEVIYNLK